MTAVLEQQYAINAWLSTLEQRFQVLQSNAETFQIMQDAQAENQTLMFNILRHRIHSTETSLSSSIESISKLGAAIDDKLAAFNALSFFWSSEVALKWCAVGAAVLLIAALNKKAAAVTFLLIFGE